MASLGLVAFLAHQFRDRKSSAYEKSLYHDTSSFVSSDLSAFLSPHLGHAGNGTNLLTVEESLRGLRDPSFFHQLNRERCFTAVFLAASDARQPLCSALLDSPVWILSSVSPAGYLFRHAGQKAWRVEDSADIKGDCTVRSEWMILTAQNLIAIGRNGDADLLLRSAEKEHGQPSMLAGVRASLAASRGHWTEALAEGRASLQGDPSNQAVRETVIRALGETGRSDEALDEARNLVTRRKDAETLFLLARTANTANSSRDEIIALQELVTYGRKTGQPIGASLSYLGQALAKSGERGTALMTFREAMTCPELSAKEQKAIREMAEHISLEKKP